MFTMIARWQWCSGAVRAKTGELRGGVGAGQGEVTLGGIERTMSDRRARHEEWGAQPVAVHHRLRQAVVGHRGTNMRGGAGGFGHWAVSLGPPDEQHPLRIIQKYSNEFELI
jgi:hypothetical protein